MGTSVADRPEQDTLGPGARPAPARWLAALAGLVAGGLALGLSEGASGLASGVPSLVGAVGQAVIDWTPGALVHLGIQRLGHHDKAFLTVAILVVSGLAAAGLGVAARRRRWPARVGFCAFGVVGVVTAGRDSRAVTGEVLVATALAVAAGLAVLEVLLRLALVGGGAGAGGAGAGSFGPAAGRRGPSPSQRAGRRAFLSTAAAAGAVGVAAAAGGRRLAKQAVVATRRGVTLPPVPAPVAPPPAGDVVDVPGISPLITANGDFYRIDTRLLGPPAVDVASWRLKITGRVDHPFELTWDELTALPMFETYLTLQCVSNEVGGNLVGNASWRGVSLPDLLRRAGVHTDADQIVGRAVDGFTVGMPTSAVFDGRLAMVAVGMNGDLLPLIHGFPARLVVAGLYGYVSATKWLSEIELTRFDAYDAYWVTRGWDQMAPIKTESRIDTINPNPPRSGPTVLAGVAWAPTRGISKVEVQVDNQPWGVARLAGALSDDTWRQWTFPWVATAGRHLIRVRATDGRGQTQTSDVAEPLPNAATGYHTVQVTIPA